MMKRALCTLTALAIPLFAVTGCGEGPGGETGVPKNTGEYKPPVNPIDMKPVKQVPKPGKPT